MRVAVVEDFAGPGFNVGYPHGFDVAECGVDGEVEATVAGEEAAEFHLCCPFFAQSGHVRQWRVFGSRTRPVPLHVRHVLEGHIDFAAFWDCVEGDAVVAWGGFGVVAPE